MLLLFSDLPNDWLSQGNVSVCLCFTVLDVSVLLSFYVFLCVTVVAPCLSVSLSLLHVSLCHCRCSMSLCHCRCSMSLCVTVVAPCLSVSLSLLHASLCHCLCSMPLCVTVVAPCLSVSLSLLHVSLCHCLCSMSLCVAVWHVEHISDSNHKCSCCKSCTSCFQFWS